MSDPTSNVTLTKEELAWLIKALVESLEIPDWTKDDLIEFGKAIFGKTPLKDMDPKKFTQLFPFLKQITDNLGIKLKEAVLPTPASTQDAPANQPGNTTPAIANPETTSQS